MELPTPQLVRRYRENEVFAVRERRDAANSPRAWRTPSEARGVKPSKKRPQGRVKSGRIKCCDEAQP